MPRQEDNIITPEATREQLKFVDVFVLALFGILLIVTDVYHVHDIVKFQNLKDCKNFEDSDRSTMFVRLTSWVLYMSNVFFVVFICRRSSCHTFWFRLFFQVVLSWSITVVIAYNITVATGDATSPLCDENAWIAMDWVSNATAHYVCGIVFFGLFYLRGFVKYNIRIPFTALVAVVFAVVLGCVHTFYSPIYSIGPIWPSCASAVVLILLIHFVLLWLNRLFCCVFFKSPQEEDAASVSPTRTEIEV